MKFVNKIASTSVLFSAGILVSLIATPSTASTLTPFLTQFDTDWTLAGYGGMRGIGQGQIELSGVSGSVSQAYLYWHGPTNSNDPNANANVLFNGNSISGNNIGFSADNFWGFQNSQAYRANVTNFVTGNGNYSLDNFIKPEVEINGASLLVFYDDGNDNNNRDVVLFDGNDSNFDNSFDPEGWDVTLSNINYDDGLANLVFNVSDGQTFQDNNLQVNGTTIASGAIFQGNTTPAGTGGPPNGSLWDIRDFDITSFLTPGNNTLNINLEPTNDALSLINLAFDVPAGSAPNQPPVVPARTPEPTTFAALLTLGSLTMAFTRKSSKAQKNLR